MNPLISLDVAKLMMDDRLRAADERRTASSRPARSRRPLRSALGHGFMALGARLAHETAREQAPLRLVR